MNVLITCAGRRGYLVDYFREVVQPLGGQVITANSEPYAAGWIAGDKRYLVPTIDSDEYIPSLLNIVRTENVRLVLSLFDLDLLLLAEARPRFALLGAELAVSETETIEIACDKWRMFTFLSQQGIDTPMTWNNMSGALDAIQAGTAVFPLVVKPRWGMGSIGVYKVNSDAELLHAVQAAQSMIETTYLSKWKTKDNGVLIQECIEGIEYGADILHDFQGNHLATVIKQKISQRPEGADFAFTLTDPELERICKDLSLAMRHRANMDVDLIRSGTGKTYVLDLNARFGGGYPFSHLAGARFPRALIQALRGDTPDPGLVRTGVYGMLDIMPREFYPTEKDATLDQCKGKNLGSDL